MPATTPVTLLAALRRGEAHLAARGVESARLDAERLFAHVLGVDRLRLYMDFERPLAADERTALRTALARRARREPLQHILGRQPFRHLDLTVTADVLVPRPETEEVVEAALAALAEARPDPARAVTVLDLGTGSGCIALALAQERPATRVVAVDRSRRALAVARDNAREAGLADRVRFLAGDLFEPLARGAAFDLIVSNPPYLTSAEWAAAAPEVRDHDPRAALVGGDDGLLFHRRILAGAGAHLAPGGRVVLEIGAGQGRAVAALAGAAGFGARVLPDLAGRDRIVVAAPEMAG